MSMCPNDHAEHLCLGVVCRPQVRLLTGSIKEPEKKQINQQLMNGVVSHTSMVTQRGQPPNNFSFPEQLISLNATRALLVTLSGGLSFHFNGKQTTTTVPIMASATEVRECLRTMDTIGEIEVFREDKTVGDVDVISWLVRFYAEGDPPHIGPQPTIYVNASEVFQNETAALPAATRRRLSGCTALTCFAVGVQTTAQGTSPFLVDAGGEGKIEGASVTADYNGQNTTGVGVQTLTYVSPTHICGNGIRTSAEQCDDNNTAGGDGCDSLCRVEKGWRCVSSNTEGTGVGGVDTCTPVCGDGIRIMWSQHAEQCDDNNTLAGD